MNFQAFIMQDIRKNHSLLDMQEKIVSKISILKGCGEVVKLKIRWRLTALFMAVCMVIPLLPVGIIEEVSASVREKTIEISNSGSLKNYITDAEKETLIKLTVRGKLGNSDINTICDLSKLEELDLSGAIYNDSETTAGVFQGLSSLKIVKLFEGFNGELTLGKDIFKDCINLTTVVLPATVIRIGENAFANCPNLTTIIILNESKVLTVASNAFGGAMPEGLEIQVPSSMYNEYAGDGNWSGITVEPVDEGGEVIETYTITYFADPSFVTGTAPVDPVSYPADRPIPVLEPAGLSARGHDFVGWKLINGTTEITFQPNEEIRFEDLGFERDIILFAQWTPATYTISFNANGGTVVNDPVTVQFNQTIDVKLPETERQGYHFAGWFTQLNGQGEQYFSSTRYTEDKNIVLYAYWEEIQNSGNEYVLTFDYQGATGGNSTPAITVSHEAEISWLPVPVRTGYTFKGWYTSAGDQYTVTTKYPIKGNMTLYAKWELIPTATYTLTFNYQGATGGNGTRTRTMTYQGTLGVMPTPTRPGYAFGGWYAAVDGKGRLYTATSRYDTQGNLTVYAKWTPLIYTVSYDYQGATGRNTIKSKQVVHRTSVGVLPTPTRTGATFLGWFTAKNGKGTRFANNRVFTNTGHVKLYAHWRINWTAADKRKADAVSKQIAKLPSVKLENVAAILKVERNYKRLTARQKPLVTNLKKLNTALNRIARNKFATSSVKTAERFRTKAMVKRARTVVNRLPKGATKTRLLNRLKKVKTTKHKLPTRVTSKKQRQQVERSLKLLGYSVGKTNGKWDKKSVSALRRFQRDNKLKVDGKYGAKTRRAMLNKLNK